MSVFPFPHRQALQRELDISLLKLLRRFWFAPQDALLRSVEKVIWSHLELSPPILDIGCGDGGISKLLFSSRSPVDVGLDLFIPATAIAQVKRVYRSVCVGDATKLPFCPASFTTVVSNSTFEHIPQDVRAVTQVAAVLKPHGQFLFTVPAPQLLTTLRKLSGSEREFKAFNHRVNHYHYRSLSTWHQILSATGLKPIFHLSYFPPALVTVWFKLFKLATFTPFRRELWSYWRDSFLKLILPHRLITALWFKYLNSHLKQAFSPQGCWTLIVAQKLP